MDDLDLDYLSTPNVDIWPKDPAQNITQSRPTSYTGTLHVALCNCRLIKFSALPTLGHSCTTIRC